MMDPNIPPEILQVLDPGETLLWWGRPSAIAYAWRLLFDQAVAVSILVSVVFGTIVAVTPFNWKDPEHYLFLIMFGWLVLPTALSPVWRLWQGRTLTYFLSDKRAGRIIKFPHASVWSMPVAHIKALVKEKSLFDSGSLAFELKAYPANSWPIPSFAGFEAVRNVDQVERTIRKFIEVPRGSSLGNKILAEFESETLSRFMGSRYYSKYVALDIIDRCVALDCPIMAVEGASFDGEVVTKQLGASLDNSGAPLNYAAASKFLKQGNHEILIWSLKLGASSGDQQGETTGAQT